jgi:NAD(P)-dependent dehydrogenase (short-subunit alcohol dehydrogenase family)
MSERVAIVVGAGGELGCATAEKLAAAGYTVAGVDRSEAGLGEQLPAASAARRLTRPTRPRPAASWNGLPPRSARRRCW